MFLIMAASYDGDKQAEVSIQYVTKQQLLEKRNRR